MKKLSAFPAPYQDGQYAFPEYLTWEQGGINSREFLTGLDLTDLQHLPARDTSWDSGNDPMPEGCFTAYLPEGWQMLTDKTDEQDWFDAFHVHLLDGNGDCRCTIVHFDGRAYPQIHAGGDLYLQAIAA